MSNINMGCTVEEMKLLLNNATRQYDLSIENKVMSFHLQDQFVDTYDTLGNYLNHAIKPQAYHIEKLLIVTGKEDADQI